MENNHDWTNKCGHDFAQRSCKNCMDMVQQHKDWLDRNPSYEEYENKHKEWYKNLKKVKASDFKEMKFIDEIDTFNPKDYSLPVGTIETKCDCGADKCDTTHYEWCSTKK